MPFPMSLDVTYLSPDVTRDEVISRQAAAEFCHKRLHDKTGAGSDFLGWMDPEKMMPDSEVERILKVAERLRAESDALAVIGIGGSYLGARAVIEALGGDKAKNVVFAGQNVSARYYEDLLSCLKDKKVAINVVSKSGTTTEPGIGFRLLWSHLHKDLGREASAKLTVATTDAQKGALRKLAEQEGYTTFVVPDDVGGRYSVFSAVGLLPIAYAGIDIKALLSGAIECAEACKDPILSSNPAYYYAMARNLMYRKGKTVEVLASFEPRLHYIAEWWKQLFGESEGKENIAIFPAAVDYTTDLHSMGQYMQEGRRFVFETFIEILGGEPDLTVPNGPTDDDQLGFLTGRKVHDVNREAYRATALAHREGRLPSCTIQLEKLDARSLGFLLYFFEKACAISGYLLDVNPFDQPGVEAYKKHMFALLNKPGFEKQSEELKNQLNQQAPEVIVFGS